MWDAELIAEGQELVRRCLRRNQPGPYQLQAAISAVHSDAPTVADTDWRQVLALYDHLYALNPTPVVALNRAVALAELEGPAVAYLAVEELDLDGYHLFHATRAELLDPVGTTRRRRGSRSSARRRSRRTPPNARTSTRAGPK